MTMGISRRGRRIAIAGLLAAFLAGCGSAQRVGTSAHVVDVNEKDFHISAPASIASGEVVFNVSNTGPDEHEFIVMRGTASQLPVKDDGLTVNEAAAKSRLVGELEPGAPGLTRSLHVRLAPGHYVFFCNMTGHFMGGMHTEVVVR